MFYMFLIWLIIMICYDKLKGWHWLPQVVLLSLLSIGVVYGVDFVVWRSGVTTTGKMLSVTEIDSLDSTNYFKEPIEYDGTEHLTYTKDGKEYVLTNADGELCFYPIPEEPERIEKYKEVYQSKIINILTPRVKHEVYYKIYSMEILSNNKN